ncbi:hypothetical protein IAR55_002818 [Kwoniella newhampshirensis]|uniref:Poly(A) RNA polymerase mitochondrial-like central palm domain-containing protein n=1 Tax=Kwoniella newhampshirensis TaxID=1651941 RepID=A0AAW0YZY4_9TREE
MSIPIFLTMTTFNDIDNHVLTPRSIPSPALITFDPPLPRLALLDLDESLDQISVGRVQDGFVGGELDPRATAFVPVSHPNSRRRSTLRTPDPVLVITHDDDDDDTRTQALGLQFGLYTHSPSPTRLSTPSPLSPSALSFNSASRSPALIPISSNYDRPLSPLSSTPGLTPDSSQSIDCSRSIGLEQKYEQTLSDLPIVYTNPQHLVSLFKCDIKPFAFPTVAAAEAAGNCDVRLPERVERLIALDESDDEGEDERPNVSDPQDKHKLGRKIDLGYIHRNTTLIDLSDYDQSQDDLTDIEMVDNSLVDVSDSPVRASRVMYPEKVREPQRRERQPPQRLYTSGSSQSSRSSTLANDDHPAQRLADKIGRSTSGIAFDYDRMSPYTQLLSQPSARVTVPPSLISPSHPDTLQTTIMRSWIKTEPTAETKQYIKNILQTLTRVINGRFGSGSNSKRFKVDVFGSVSWGGDTGKSGDLDMVILDTQLPQGYHPSLWRIAPDDTMTTPSNSHRVPKAIDGLPGIYHTYALADCLRKAGMGEVMPIPAATAPIVKFVDAIHLKGWQCDINANDLGGWYNSSLILQYCSIAPHLLRPMIHTLKLWASAQDLNDPSGSKGPATMSSYCITLMAIAYLQHRGCLPNLQANVEVPIPCRPADTSDLDSIWVSWSKDQGIRAHVAFDRSPPPGWTSREPNLVAADAVRGFFAFFSQAEPYSPHADRFDYDKQIISILQGGVAARARVQGADKAEDDRQRQQMIRSGYSMQMIQQVMGDQKKRRLMDEENMGKGDRGIQPKNWSERQLVVQDPFLWQKNCAGAMSKTGLDRWLAAVDIAHSRLQSTGTSATLDNLLLNLSPMTSGMPRRGRGGRGSPSPSVSSRGSRGPRGTRGGGQLFRV